MLARLLLVLVVLAPALRADVLVVDGAGGGDFTTLAAAVAAADDGDTLLVRDGDYVEEGPVVIDAKSLTISGEWSASGGPLVSIRPGLVVRNLPPTKHVVLQNLALLGADGSALVVPSVALVLRDNNAHVRVQSCWLSGGAGQHNSQPAGAAGLDIEDSISTGLIGCFVSGGDGQFSPNLGVIAGYGAPGVTLFGGQLLLSASEVQGGRGGSNSVGGFAQGGDGGAGVAQSAGVVLAAGSWMRGGDGGTSHFGGDGGHGLAMGGTGFALLMGGSGASGGQGGSSDVGPNGQAGLGVFDPSSVVTNLGGLQRDFDVTSPLREGQPGKLFLGALPAERTLLFASLSLHQIVLPGYQGALMLSPSALLGPFVFGPPGNQQINFVGPGLPPGLECLLVHIQPAYLGTAGVNLGPGRVLTLLDASF